MRGVEGVDVGVAPAVGVVDVGVGGGGGAVRLEDWRRGGVKEQDGTR